MERLTPTTRFRDLIWLGTFIVIFMVALVSVTENEACAEDTPCGSQTMACPVDAFFSIGLASHLSWSVGALEAPSSLDETVHTDEPTDLALDLQMDTARDVLAVAPKTSPPVIPGRA